MNFPLKIASIIYAILFCTKIIGTYGIINGRDPKLGEIKYVVAISVGGSCSGGIIGNKHILTAAHCVKVGNNNQLKPTRVVAATNTSSNYNTNVSVVKYVKRAFLPAAYVQNKKKGAHDIAVLELSGSIQIDKNSHKLQKLELPTPIKTNPVTYADHIGKKFKAAGFGASKVKFVPGKNGKMQSKTWGGGRLQVADAIVLNNQACKRVWGGNMEKRMCSAIIADPERKTFQGFCAGDSGTPIVVDEKIVIGVHVAGGNCNNNVHPSVDIRTTAFMSFIENAMNGTITPDMVVYNAW